MSTNNEKKGQSFAKQLRQTVITKAPIDNPNAVAFYDLPPLPKMKMVTVFNAKPERFKEVGNLISFNVYLREKHHQALLNMT